MALELIPRFDDTPEGQKRSVFFSIGVATGFLCIVAATASLVEPVSSPPIAAVLIILGSLAFGFSAMTALGRFGWLYAVE